MLPIFKNEEEVLTQILDFWFPQTIGSGDMRLRSGSLLEGLHGPSHHCFLLPAWPGGFQFLRNEKQVDEKLRFLSVRTRRGKEKAWEGQEGWAKAEYGVSTVSKS